MDRIRRRARPATGHAEAASMDLWLPLVTCDGRLRYSDVGCRRHTHGCLMDALASGRPMIASTFDDQEKTFPDITLGIIALMRRQGLR